MRWWVILLVVGAAASIVAVVLAISSVTNHGDVERVKTALKLQTNCATIAVGRPSHAAILKRWSGKTAQSADIRCVETGAALVYAKFADHAALERAIATNPPTGHYCLLDSAIVIDRLVRVPSTVMSDTCQSVGGTLIASGE
jgi:hypothetical protein